MKNFALVGCGLAGSMHAPLLQGLGRLLAVCDNEEEKATAFGQRFGAAVYSDFDNLLATETAVDTVVVCTPNGLHAEQVIKSLQARKNVICESPLCLTGAAAWQMIETEKFCRRKVYLVLPLSNGLLSPVENEVVQQKITGVAGAFDCLCTAAVNSEAWKKQRFPGGGLLYTNFTEAIFLLDLLFGPIVKASGQPIPRSDVAEKSGEVKLEMENGITGSLRWSVTDAATEGEIKISVNNEPLRTVLLPSATRAGTDNVYAERLRAFYKAFETDPGSLPGMHQGRQLVENIEKIYNAIRPL